MKHHRTTGRAISMNRAWAACRVPLLLLPILVASPAGASDAQPPSYASRQPAYASEPTAVRDAIAALHAACRAWGVPKSQTGSARSARPSDDELTCRSIASRDDGALTSVREPRFVSEAIAAMRVACASWQPIRAEPGDVYVSREPGPDALVCSMTEDPDGTYLLGMLSLATLAMTVLALATGVAMMAWWFVRTVRSRRQEDWPVSRSVGRPALAERRDVA